MVVLRSDSQVMRKAGRRRARLLVLGVGNLLMSDDGVGVHVVRELQKRPHAGVLVTEVGTAIFDATSLLGWADRVLVIDALYASGPPGTIYFAGFPSVLQCRGHMSLHELDISAAMELMPRKWDRPEVFVMGVEPESLAMGLELSAEVLAAVPKVVLEVDAKLKAWRSEFSMSKASASVVAP